jgi:hypothetical protein
MYISCIEEAYKKSFEYLKTDQTINKWDMELSSSITMFHSDLMNIFIEKYGFKKLDYQVNISIWEFLNDDPNDDKDIKDKVWIKIKHHLVSLAELHREKIRKDILETRQANGLSNEYEDEENTDEEG